MELVLLYINNKNNSNRLSPLSPRCADLTGGLASWERKGKKNKILHSYMC